MNHTLTVGGVELSRTLKGWEFRGFHFDRVSGRRRRELGPWYVPEFDEYYYRLDAAVSAVLPVLSKEIARERRDLDARKAAQAEIKQQYRSKNRTGRTR